MTGGGVFAHQLPGHCPLAPYACTSARPGGHADCVQSACSPRASPSLLPNDRSGAVPMPHRSRRCADTDPVRLRARYCAMASSGTIQLFQRLAQMIVGVGICGIGFDYRTKMLLGILDIALVLQQDSAHVVSAQICSDHAQSLQSADAERDGFVAFCLSIQRRNSEVHFCFEPVAAVFRPPSETGPWRACNRSSPSAPRHDYCQRCLARSAVSSRLISGTRQQGPDKTAAAIFRSGATSLALASI